MKPVYFGSSVGLDRLATWNEVRCAISVSAGAVFALDGAGNDSRETDSAFSGSAYNLPEDDMWLAIIREMPDSKSN
jgi:hypothetical protein